MTNLNFYNTTSTTGCKHKYEPIKKRTILKNGAKIHKILHSQCSECGELFYNVLSVYPPW